MDATDMLDWENEVKEMMDRVKTMYDKLWDRKASYNDIAELEPEGNKRYQNSNMNLEDSLAQIENLKVILETKVAEGKKAKLYRMQSEGESRNILLSLTCDEVSNALKNNSRDFMNLLNESGKINDDKKRSVREKEDGTRERDKSQICIKPMKFIERNIQLAQYGKGVFSLTDEEKLRIQNLLMDDEEDHKVNNDSGEPLKRVFNKNFYGFDDDSKFLLKRIDKQLEAFPRHLNTSESRQYSVEKEIESYKDKGNVNNNNNDIDSKKFKRKNKNKRRNLKEIEKLLRDLNSVTDKEISPLPSEEMELLIREARQNFQNSVVKGSEEPELNENFKFISSKDLIMDLVLNAKCLMPKFKFRYDDS